MKSLNRLAASIGIKKQIAAMESQVQRLFNREPLADSQRERTLFHRLARLGNQVDQLSERTSLKRIDGEVAEAVAKCQQELNRLEAAWIGPRAGGPERTALMNRTSRATELLRGNDRPEKPWMQNPQLLSGSLPQ